MRFSAGFGVGVGTVLALGGPAQSFHSNIGSKALLFQGTYVMPASGQTCTRGEHGALRHGRGTVIEEEAGGLWHAAGERDRRSRWLKRPLARRTSTSASAHGKQGAQGEEMSMEASTERKIRSHPAACRASNLGNMGKDIFCNRELNMKQIKAVGFDMDYTLAQYFTAFDQLAFDGAKEKLIGDLGYPELVHTFDYDPEYFSRGLVIDLQRGNIIKMDRHRYIRVAFHGFKKLASEERKHIYLDQEKLHTFTGPKYVSMDTLFSLVDAVLYAHLVDLKDSHPQLVPGKSYEQLFRDVRECVDLCHRDGVIKDRVEEDPGRYILEDPDIVPTLKRLRKEGTQVFLLTNSLWDYTDVVMNFLAGNARREDRTTEWLDLFDAAIVGACKPGFLVEPRLPIFRVDTTTGSLSNTDGMVTSTPEGYLGEGKVFQGGNWLHLHQMLGLSSGDQVLYVGDHMFADIVRSKRTLGWRTCLIVPELEGEMLAHRENQELRNEVNMLRTLQYDLDLRVDRVRLQAMEQGASSPAAVELARLEDEQIRLKTLLRDETLLFHSKFHEDWGQLFKSGYQDSRFATQVATYACIYTSRVSNLATVSTQRSFRPVRDVAAHDLLLETGDNHSDAMEAMRRRVLNSREERLAAIKESNGGPGMP